MSLSRRKPAEDRKELSRPHGEDVIDGRGLPATRRKSPSKLLVFVLFAVFIVLVVLEQFAGKGKGDSQRVRLRSVRTAHSEQAQSNDSPPRIKELSPPPQSVIEERDSEQLYACGVSKSKLDDDFCDCPNDGSDEPNTGACSPLGVLKCGSRLIPSSKVRDGVVDCCNGEDEGLRPGTFVFPSGC